MALKPYVAKFLEGNPLAGLTTVEDLINYRGTVREILPQRKLDRKSKRLKIVQ